MKGALKSRKGSHSLRRRCPDCKKLRKFCEPDGNHGGEDHPRRPEWGAAPDGHRICGWCFERQEGAETVTASGGQRGDIKMTVTRDVKTGRVLSTKKFPSKYAQSSQGFYERGVADKAKYNPVPPPGARSARKRRATV